MPKNQSKIENLIKIKKLLSEFDEIRPWISSADRQEVCEVFDISRQLLSLYLRADDTSIYGKKRRMVITHLVELGKAKSSAAERILEMRKDEIYRRIENNR